MAFFNLRRSRFSSISSDLALPLSTDAREVVGERLNKFISSTGYCSRRDAEKLIHEGRVTLNDAKASLSSRATTSDSVFVDGLKLKKDVAFNTPRLWMIHKLRGELVTAAAEVDAKYRPRLIERVLKLGVSREAIPVNRLEFNTEGLCLYTDNAQFARFLENSQRTDIAREYKVRIHGLITESKVDGLRRGMFVDGVKYRPIGFQVQAKRGDTGTISWATATVFENKSKVLRKCFEKLYLKSLRLICTGYGPFKLGGLPSGAVATMKLPPDLTAEFNKHQAQKR